MSATNATRSVLVGSAGCSGGAVGEAKVIQVRGSRRSQASKANLEGR